MTKMKITNWFLYFQRMSILKILNWLKNSYLMKKTNQKNLIILMEQKLIGNKEKMLQLKSLKRNKKTKRQDKLEPRKLKKSNTHSLISLKIPMLENQLWKILKMMKLIKWMKDIKLPWKSMMLFWMKLFHFLYNITLELNKMVKRKILIKML